MVVHTSKSEQFLFKDPEIRWLLYFEILSHPLGHVTVPIILLGELYYPPGSGVSIVIRYTCSWNLIPDHTVLGCYILSTRAGADHRP
jgi:hypothetical protein